MDDLFSRVASVGVGPRKQAAGLDFYSTPAWATQALLNAEMVQGEVWEPCCGSGAIARVIASNGHNVVATDIASRGFGGQRDFLKDSPLEADWIITNPPYTGAEKFVYRALEATAARRGKVAMLLRLAFLEGQARIELFRNTPLKRVHVFTSRVDFVPGKSSPMPAAWFVWDHEFAGEASLGWLHKPRAV